MRTQRCEDISVLYKYINENYEVVIAYDFAHQDAENKVICVSPRREFNIMAKSKTDVLLVVYCKYKSFYSVKKLAFDKYGKCNIAPILDALGVERISASLEIWNIWTKGRTIESDICIFENGYYTINNFKICCNDVFRDAWHVDIFMTDGIDIDGKRLKYLRYTKIFEKIEDDFYAFIDKMISKGCNSEEYIDFKGKYFNPSFPDEFIECFE